MILLDTNVVSEPMRAVPNERVLGWIDAQAIETLYLAAVTVAELRAGVACLPAGRRRNRLAGDLEERLLPLFASRVLPFDLACTAAYATLIAKARSTGRAVASADACIAAIAITHRFAVATRDIGPFQAAGAAVIDPWQA